MLSACIVNKDTNLSNMVNAFFLCIFTINDPYSWFSKVRPVKSSQQRLKKTSPIRKCCAKSVYTKGSLWSVFIPTELIFPAHSRQSLHRHKRLWQPAMITTCWRWLSCTPRPIQYDLRKYCQTTPPVASGDLPLSHYRLLKLIDFLQIYKVTLQKHILLVGF